MVPNGDGPRDHPLLKPLNLPPLGNPGPQLRRSSTKTLLFVGEGDPIMVDRGHAPAARDAARDRARRRRPKFRAFDKATGAVLWETELPAGTTGAPMTYMFEGKQYIVVAIGVARASGRVRRAQPAVMGRRGCARGHAARGDARAASAGARDGTVD